MHGLLQVYADDSVFCKKKIKERLGVQSAAKRKQNQNERQNQHITR